MKCRVTIPLESQYEGTLGRVMIMSISLSFLSQSLVIAVDVTVMVVSLKLGTWMKTQ